VGKRSRGLRRRQDGCVGGRKADAERLTILIKALTGKRRLCRMDGKIGIVCGRST